MFEAAMLKTQTFFSDHKPQIQKIALVTTTTTAVVASMCAAALWSGHKQKDDFLRDNGLFDAYYSFDED